MTPESSSPPSASCSRFRRQRFYPSQPRRWRAPRRALPAMSPTSAAGLAFPLRWRTLRVTEHMRRSKIGRVDSRRLQPSLQQLEAYLTRLIAEQRFQKNENSRAAFVPPMKHLWVRTRGIRRATRGPRVKHCRLILRVQHCRLHLTAFTHERNYSIIQDTSSRGIFRQHWRVSEEYAAKETKV